MGLLVWAVNLFAVSEKSPTAYTTNFPASRPPILKRTYPNMRARDEVATSSWYPLCRSFFSNCSGLRPRPLMKSSACRRCSLSKCLFPCSLSYHRIGLLHSNLPKKRGDCEVTVQSCDRMIPSSISLPVFPISSWPDQPRPRTSSGRRRRTVFDRRRSWRRRKPGRRLLPLAPPIPRSGRRGW